MFRDRVVAKPPPKKATVWKSKFYGAFVSLYAIEQTQVAQWRCRPPAAEREVTAASSRENEI